MSDDATSSAARQSLRRAAAGARAAARGRGARSRPAGSSTAPCATEDLEHGRAEATPAADAGEIAGRDERRRPDRPDRRRAGRRATRRWASSPAGAATTSRACSGSRPRSRARSTCSRRATTRAIDVGEVNGRRFLGIASCGFDSDANRIANEAKLIRGNLVYLYAALRALAAVEAGALHARRSTASAREFTRLLRRRREQQAPTAAGCSSPRTPSSTTACSTSSMTGDVEQAALPG